MFTRRLVTSVAAAGLASVALTVLSPLSSASAAPLLRVDQGADCSTRASRADVVAGRAVWCSPQLAARHVRSGDRVLVAPGVYSGTLTLGKAASGTSWSGTRAVLAGGRQRSGLVVRDAANVDVAGFTVTGGTGQAVWIERSRTVALDGVHVTRSAGAGIQVIRSRGVSLTNPVIDDNTRVGLRIAKDSVGTRVSGARITQNGKDGEAYNGDGIQIAGDDTRVTDSTVSANGDHGVYEHGIYVTADAEGTRLVRLVAERNSGTQLRTSGGVTCTDCVFTGGRFALYAGGRAARLVLDACIVNPGTAGGVLAVGGATVVTT